MFISTFASLRAHSSHRQVTTSQYSFSRFVASCSHSLFFFALLALLLFPSWSLHRENCSAIPPCQGFHPALHLLPCSQPLHEKRCRDWLRSHICTTVRCRHLFDTEISILNSFLHPRVSCIEVHRCASFRVLLPINPTKNLT